MHITKESIPSIYTCPHCEERLSDNISKNKISPLDLLLLVAESKVKIENMENTESKSKNSDEPKEGTKQSSDWDMDIKESKVNLQIPKAPRTLKSIIGDSK